MEIEQISNEKHSKSGRMSVFSKILNCKSSIPLLFTLLTMIMRTKSEITMVSRDDISNSLDSDNPVLLITLSMTNKNSKALKQHLPSIESTLTLDFPSLKIIKYVADPVLQDEDILFEKYDIMDYPSAIISKNGVWSKVSEQEVDEKKIIEVARKKLARTVISARSMNDIEDYKDHSISVVYFSESPSDDRKAQGLAYKYHRYRFVKVEDRGLMDSFCEMHGFHTKQKGDERKSADSTLLVVLRHADDTVDFFAGDLYLNHRKANMKIHRMGGLSWVMFNSKSMKWIDETEKYVVLYVYNHTIKKQTQKDLKDISERYRDDVIVFFMDISDTIAENYMNILGLEGNESNFYVLHRDIGSHMFKYISNPNTTKSIIRMERFIQKCMDGKAKRFFMSESKAPSMCVVDGPEKLVGLTIGEYVFQDKYFIHITFFHNKKTDDSLDTFLRFAKKIKHKKVKFYLFDTDKNEHQDVPFAYYGSIVIISNQLQTTFERILYVDKEVKQSKLFEFVKEGLSQDRETSKYMSTIQLKEEA